MNMGTVMSRKPQLVTFSSKRTFQDGLTVLVTLTGALCSLRPQGATSPRGYQAHGPAPPISVSLHLWSSHFSLRHSRLEGLSEWRLLSPVPRVLDSVILGHGLRICISNKFFSDADKAGLGQHCESHWHKP